MALSIERLSDVVDAKAEGSESELDQLPSQKLLVVLLIVDFVSLKLLLW